MFVVIAVVQHNDIELDRLYEASWTPANSGLDSVLAFLSQHRTRPYNAETVCSLIEIDLERSWLTWNNYVNTLPVSSNCEAVLGQLKELPRLTDYRSLLEEVQTTKSQYRQLVTTEYEVRNQSGDMIGAAYYQLYFGVEVAECDTDLRRLYFSGNGPSRSELANGIPLHGLNLMGRRRSADARNLDVEYKPEGNRIIVAPKDDRTVSRIQASLQILNSKYACLRNEGTVNALVLVPRDVLQPGEAMIVKFPFEVRLPNTLLSFR